MPYLTLTLIALSFLVSTMAVPAPGATPRSDPHAGEYRPYNEGESGERYFQIHPNYDDTKCLDVRGSRYTDGTPVDIFDCNGTSAQNWVIQPGTTQVKLAGRNFCLDAGNPKNGSKMKIWTCYPGLPAQTWYYTDDKRIALKNQGFCLDLTDGVSENFQVMQVWKCSRGNVNQIWSV